MSFLTSHSILMMPSGSYTTSVAGRNQMCLWATISTKSPRADGKQHFTIDEQPVSEFEELEAHQFDCCNIYNKVRVWAIFGNSLLA